MRLFSRFPLSLLTGCLLLILSPMASQAQDELYIEKPPFKRDLIQPGDSIRIQFVGSKQMFGFTYQGARDSMLFVSGDSIPLSIIERFWLRRPKSTIHWLSMIVGSGLSAAIIFPPLMALDAITRGGFEDYDFRRIGISVGGGITVAALFYRWRWKRYRLGDKWRLAIREPIENTVGGGSPSGGQQEWEGQAPIQGDPDHR